MSISYSFAGKNVLITGGTQGIGRQLVQRFHDGGANVFTVARTPENIQKLRDELPGVRAEVLDLADWDKTKEMVESFGVIDCLVNNAVTGTVQHFMEITKEAATSQFDVNLSAVINVTQVVAKRLIREGREGTVVNIGSIVGRTAFSCGNIVYSVTKAGLECLTKCTALELGAHKIRVNCVLPGVVATPLVLNNINEYANNTIIPRMIIKRLIKEDEVAEVVMFLLSPLSSMMVGESVVVDGGYLTT